METSPRDTVGVRPAEPADALHLQRNCLSTATVEQVRAQIEENARDQDRFQLVATVGGAVVGNAVLIREEHPLRRHRAGLYSLVVSEPYQGRGIARRLVGEVAAQAAGIDIEILETSCRGGEPAEEVYPRLRFVEYGRLTHGLAETWGEQRVFAEVYFVMPTSRD
jgi:GNAT superfamily N-acetyltransferase